MNYKKPSEVQADYIQILESLVPSLTPIQTDSNFWIQGAAIGGTISGLYSDQQAVEGDIFPQTARLPALQRFLTTYGLEPQIQPQVADGNILVSGIIGTTYSLGVQFTNTSTG